MASESTNNVSIVDKSDNSLDGLTLDQVRLGIDGIDKQLIRLLNERMKFSKQVGIIKARTSKQSTQVNEQSNNNANSTQTGQLVYVPSRERTIFNKIIDLNNDEKGLLSNVAACAIWREIMSASIGLQKQTIVAVAGGFGSFAYEAAIKRFGASVNYICCEGDSRINSVVESCSLVEKGGAQYAVVPLHHSQTGTIASTLKLLSNPNNQLKIYSELFVSIEYALLASQLKHLSEYKIIYGQPRALSACRSFINRFLPKIKVECVGSLTFGLNLLRQNHEGLCIASQMAADQNNYFVRASSISDMNLVKFSDYEQQEEFQQKENNPHSASSPSETNNIVKSTLNSKDNPSNPLDSWSSWDECVPSCSDNDNVESNDWTGAFDNNNSGVCRYLVMASTCDVATGDDKTFLLFSVVDKQGALQEALNSFSENGVNLTQIESRAVRHIDPLSIIKTSQKVNGTGTQSNDRIFDYWFFVEVDGHIDELPVQRSIQTLSSKCKVKILGSCPACPNKPPYTPYPVST